MHNSQDTTLESQFIRPSNIQLSVQKQSNDIYFAAYTYYLITLIAKYYVVPYEIAIDFASVENLTKLCFVLKCFIQVLN